MKCLRIRPETWASTSCLPAPSISASTRNMALGNALRTVASRTRASSWAKGTPAIQLLVRNTAADAGHMDLISRSRRPRYRFRNHRQRGRAAGRLADKLRDGSNAWRIGQCGPSSGRLSHSDPGRYAYVRKCHPDAMYDIPVRFLLCTHRIMPGRHSPRGACRGPLQPEPVRSDRTGPRPACDGKESKT